MTSKRKEITLLRTRQGVAPAENFKLIREAPGWCRPAKERRR